MMELRDTTTGERWGFHSPLSSGSSGPPQNVLSYTTQLHDISSLVHKEALHEIIHKHQLTFNCLAQRAYRCAH